MTGELSFGEKAAGLSFNPDGLTAIAEIKRAYVIIIDSLNDICRMHQASEIIRFTSVTITEDQTTQMWTVKAITWAE